MGVWLGDRPPTRLPLPVRRSWLLSLSGLRLEKQPSPPRPVVGFPQKKWTLPLYRLQRMVRTLAGTTEKFARTSILKQWLEQNLVRFSRSKVYRLLREHKKSGEIPPKGYYGGNSGRPPLQQEGGLTIEELVDYNTKRKHHRASMSQDKSKKKQKSASHHQEEDTDSGNDSEDEVCTSP
jgi:hypothetical protein